jgi:hypothetical protein
LVSNGTTSNNKINNALGFGEDALTNGERHAEGKERSPCKKEEELYYALDETQPIAVKDGFVTFCHHFEYFGSFISFNLCNNYDVKKRVTAATQSMGALKNVWNSPHLDIWSNYIFSFGQFP